MGGKATNKAHRAFPACSTTHATSSSFFSPSGFSFPMDTPVPSRLRLVRNYAHMKSPDNDDTPVAGPSRISPPWHFRDVRDEDDDTQSTPRITANAHLAGERDSPTSHSSSAPLSEYHSRLRDALSRMNSLNSPTAPAPPSDSERDSDYESVDRTSEAPSFHQQSVRKLFSRALRDPGDTPQKPRHRRNSIDASEVEESPRKERVSRERAEYKGKRKSISDEEAERLTSAPLFLFSILVDDMT